MAPKLLLVEDSLSIQTIVETTFTREGFEVLVVSDALEGLQRVQAVGPDIVLVDASIPGMDGFQLCQRIRQSPHGRQLPVVLLTSGFTTYDATRGERVGVTAHMAKPFEPRLLLDLVKSLVPPAAAEDRPTEEAWAVPSEAASGEAWDAAPTLPEPPGLAPWEAAAPLTDVAVPSELSALPLPAIPLPDEPLPVALGGMAQMLGEQLLQSLREALEAQMATLCAALMPQMLATVREVVHTQMPEMLALLLQQEIAKLKQAVEHEQPEA